MKPLQRFRRGGWVLGYIKRGFNNRKHMILFRVDAIERHVIDTSCRWAIFEEFINDAGDVRVDEMYWEPNDSLQEYDKRDMAFTNYSFFHVTHEEAMMILLEDI